jgi:hypothetical protein
MRKKLDLNLASEKTDSGRIRRIVPPLSENQLAQEAPQVRYRSLSRIARAMTGTRWNDQSSRSQPPILVKLAANAHCWQGRSNNQSISNYQDARTRLQQG